MRRERELDSTVRRPAEAEKFRCEKLAEATRNRMIMEAEVTYFVILTFKCSDYFKSSFKWQKYSFSPIFSFSLDRSFID